MIFIIILLMILIGAIFGLYGNNTKIESKLSETNKLLEQLVHSVKQIEQHTEVNRKNDVQANSR